jgi:hypothetical protein
MVLSLPCLQLYILKSNIKNWFYKSIEGGKRIMLLALGYTNKQLAI